LADLEQDRTDQLPTRKGRTASDGVRRQHERNRPPSAGPSLTPAAWVRLWHLQCFGHQLHLVEMRWQSRRYSVRDRGRWSHVAGNRVRSRCPRMGAGDAGGQCHHCDAGLLRKPPPTRLTTGQLFDRGLSELFAGLGVRFGRRIRRGRILQDSSRIRWFSTASPGPPDHIASAHGMDHMPRRGKTTKLAIRNPIPTNS
jgi:hypothetical protein